MIAKKAQKASIGILAALVALMAAPGALAAGDSCEITTESHSYLSGLCPSDHSENIDNQKISHTYTCEMMANADYIVKEIDRTITCEAPPLVTTAEATLDSRAPASARETTTKTN